MPKTKQTMSWLMLRSLCEAWEYKRVCGKHEIWVTSMNPPEGCEKRQKPFYIKYITGKGQVEEGECICLKVFVDKKQRMVRFVKSGAIRRVRDYLVMEVNGIRIVTH